MLTLNLALLKTTSTEEEVDRRGGKNMKEWTGMDFASSTMATGTRTRWEGIVVTSLQGFNRIKDKCACIVIQPGKHKVSFLSEY